MSYYRLDFIATQNPKGMTTAAIRSCCGCGEVLSSMGGGGTYMCQSCIRVLTCGLLQKEFRSEGGTK